MYNLHCHSLLSDGCLLPSEVAMRYLAAGYKAIAITDHADYSNIRAVVASIVEFCRHWPKNSPLRVLPGVELTHLPAEQFKPLARYARTHGARIIIGHGQTPVEPVVTGTNRAVLQADIDILAHPGLITDADVLLAKQRGVFLELTSRRGHKEGNAHVARRAIALGAPLIINHDSHSPDDIITFPETAAVAIQAGLTQEQIDTIYRATESLVERRKI